MRFLITGSAGFIGYHLAARLLADGHVVAGVDGRGIHLDRTVFYPRGGGQAGDAGVPLTEGS